MQIPEKTDFSDEFILSALVVLGGMSIESVSRVLKSESQRNLFYCPEIDPIWVRNCICRRALREMEVFGSSTEYKFGSFIWSYFINSDKREFLGIQLSKPDPPILNCCFSHVSHNMDSAGIKEMLKYKLSTLNLELTNYWIVRDTSLDWIETDELISVYCYNEAIHRAFLETFCRKLTPDDPCTEILTDDYYEKQSLDGNLRLNTHIEVQYALLDELKQLITHFYSYSNRKISRSLKLHGRGRWDILIPLIENILLDVEGDVFKSAKDKDGAHEINKFKELSEIVSLWNETKYVVEDITSTTIIEADAILQQFVRFVRASETKWGRTYLANLRTSIAKARNQDIVTLAYYLSYVKIPEASDDIMTYSSKKEVMSAAAVIMRKMKMDNIDQRLQVLANYNCTRPEMKELQFIVSTLRPTVVEEYKVASLSSDYFTRIATPEDNEFLSYLYFLKASDRIIKTRLVPISPLVQEPPKDSNK